MTAPRMQDYYAARAPEYDRIYSKPERQDDLRQIERWLPPLFAGASVLEVACGTGYWTQFIAPVATQVVAVDAAPETMRIARDRPANRNVEFVEGDAYALALALDGRRFQRGFAGFWFSHVPRSRVREFLLGFNAALEPGATVVLLDNLYVEGSSTPISETDDEGNTYQARRLDDGTTHRLIKNFPSEQEL
ncbi:MAG TPA: class I SAM-dependent methyltransferase, partial [Ramlibacter sp.]|nr:class I SAM-dependent methyltransferase [Ramlibacter sp.]